jgi:FMN reductase (NADPH)
MLRHRTIRRFRDEPLGHAVLERLIVAGTRASTSSNMQLYSIISVEEGQRKADLANLCADQKQIHQIAAFLVFCADLRRVVLAADMHDVRQTHTEQAEALVTAVIDTALVMQNVAVAAESMGLGICMIGAMRNHPRAVVELLKLPKHVFALAGFCIGHPDDDPAVKPRLPLEAVWHRETYPSDESICSGIRDYDDIMTDWNNKMGLHAKDPRWSKVMSKRLDGFLKRADVGEVLRAQGFLGD